MGKTGIPLVPAYSLGNTAVYSPWFDSFGIMERLSRLLRVSIFAFWGRCGLPIPRRANITMLLGSPIIPSKVEQEPSPSDVDDLHELLLNRITETFNLHKAACGWAAKTL